MRSINNNQSGLRNGRGFLYNEEPSARQYFSILFGQSNNKVNDHSIYDSSRLLRKKRENVDVNVVIIFVNLTYNIYLQETPALSILFSK